MTTAQLLLWLTALYFLGFVVPLVYRDHDFGKD